MESHFLLARMSEATKKRSMKLVVEVVDAYDLMPKDGEGSASPFAEVDFLNQLSKTKTIPKNLNPVWNQKLLFDFDQTKSHNHLRIEVSIYHHERRPIPGRHFLGRVRIPCSNLVRKGEEVYQRFPLEKKWFLSSVKGEVGLKIYISPQSETTQPPTSSLPKPKSPKNTTNLDSKTFTALPKVEELAAVDAPKSLPEEEISRISLNEDIKEPAKVTVEPIQEFLKQQVVLQPGQSVEKQPQGVPFTMHSMNLQQERPGDQEEYNLKDTNPELGERWPNGGGYGGRGWMSGES